MRSALVVPSLLVVALAALFAIPEARAERFRLKSGETLHAEPVGWLDHGDQVVLTAKGKRQTLAAKDVASVESGHPLPEKLTKKLENLRRKHWSKREKLVSKVLSKFGRTAEAERAAVLDELQRFAPAELVKPLGRVLEKSRKEHAVVFALNKLGQLEGVDAERPLVRTSILAKGGRLRARAYRSAAKLDRTRVRTYYEQVAGMPTAHERRLRAMDYLAHMKDPKATPGLIFALERVEMEIQATLATGGDLKSVPVNLGTQGGAAINAPIELPEATITSVKAKVGISTLREVASRARKTLSTINGDDHGADSKSWKAWWESRRPDR